jgi:predicted ArsR family transcriptional regulator
MQAFKDMLSQPQSPPRCTLVTGLAETERWMSDAIVKLLRLNGRPMCSKEVGEALCIPQSRAERHLERLRAAGDILRQRESNGRRPLYYPPRPKPY